MFMKRRKGKKLIDIENKFFLEIRKNTSQLVTAIHHKNIMKKKLKMYMVERRIMDKNVLFQCLLKFVG
jgi:hypothetical protein